MRCEPLALLAALATTAACATANNPTPPSLEPTFESMVENVLTPKCTFAQCHSSTTAAAGLDLTPEKACGELVDVQSCLLPHRTRIVPGKPEDSFFFHKLTGEGLATEMPASGACGFGLATPTNLLMPFGAAELSLAELKLVHDWIADGAECEGTPDPTPPSVTDIVLNLKKPVPFSKEPFSITIKIDQPAVSMTGKDGQRVMLETNGNLLGVPSTVVVPEGETSVTFDALAMNPTSRFKFVARIGDRSKEIVMRIGGLEIAEVLANPVGNDDQLQWIKLRNRTMAPIDLSGYQIRSGENDYNFVALDLEGTIPALGCAVVGGTSSTSSNGNPVFMQSVNFEPNLPHSRPQSAGYALFADNAENYGGVATPVDTMLVGANNFARLLGPDAENADPYCTTPGAGMSALRTGPKTCVHASMQPTICPSP